MFFWVTPPLPPSGLTTVTPSVSTSSCHALGRWASADPPSPYPSSNSLSLSALPLLDLCCCLEAICFSSISKLTFRVPFCQNASTPPSRYPFRRISASLYRRSCWLIYLSSGSVGSSSAFPYLWNPHPSHPRPLGMASHHRYPPPVPNPHRHHQPQTAHPTWEFLCHYQLWSSSGQSQYS